MAEGARQSRMYLIAEPTADGGTPERVRQALRLADIACVLIAPRAGTGLDKTEAKILVEIIQHHGVAAIVAGDAHLAKQLGADGVHLSLAAAATDDEEIALCYRSARSVVGPDRIIGAAAGVSRHDAMTWGELGVDYVAFGATGKPTRHSDERLAALVQWWSEVIEVPSVAFSAATADEARALCSAGADFVAVPLDSLSQTGATTRELSRALSTRESAV